MTDVRDTPAEVIRRLDPLYADRTTGLGFGSPLQLLVATILSAQCTDERVNLVTPRLFARYPTVHDLALADRQELEGIIHSCGFFRNKAKSIQMAASALIERFGGEVPGTMEELVTLPGVARKTANVVLSHAFGRNEGIAVDTHVQRLSQRLGITENTVPEKIERDLMAATERNNWGRMSDVLIWHGRMICRARSPRCPECALSDICPSAVLPGATVPAPDMP
ncbi:MAG: endonuclease III [Chloroflexota bacterium]